MRLKFLFIGFTLIFSGLTSSWSKSSSVFLDDLTSTEVKQAIHDGVTTIIIPIGGTEQTGPHIALGKHNVRVKYLAGKIAEKLGNVLVAPVLAYVPEGSISPPSGHMRFPGTISIPSEVFRSIIVASAGSLKSYGFVDIVLIGDHGGYQKDLKAIEILLNHSWRKEKSVAHYVSEYYRASDIEYANILISKGLTAAKIGKHGGTSDTSLMLAVDKTLVRTELLNTVDAKSISMGVDGDPSAATENLGIIGVNLVIDKSVDAIRKFSNRATHK
jgi:creatinine amidohydrolase